jgi:chaperone modulatory protein CbpM
MVEAMLDDARLSLDELCRAVAVEPAWVRERVEAGLLDAPAGEPTAWRFDVVAFTRVRRMVRIERDFEAVPELAALVADLAEEVAALRHALRRGTAG